MTTYFTQYPMPHNYNFPVVAPEWNPIVPLELSNYYTPPYLQYPVAIITAPQPIAPTCPFTVIATETVVPAIVTSTVANAITPVICGDIYNHLYTPTVNYTYETIPAVTNVVHNEIYFSDDEIALPQAKVDEVVVKSTEKDIDLIELYLQLPKDLFPSAKMILVDPNPIIDEFCKLENVNENISWILDLEFGVPRAPVTRAIAVYDVKYNSVHCKNTPSAIHPGFEKCNGDFKRVLLFYYDCIVSNWYNGYMVSKCDKSVENFQTWLLIPMQVFGMCWC